MPSDVAPAATAFSAYSIWTSFPLGLKVVREKEYCMMPYIQSLRATKQVRDPSDETAAQHCNTALTRACSAIHIPETLPFLMSAACNTCPPGAVRASWKPGVQETQDTNARKWHCVAPSVGHYSRQTLVDSVLCSAYGHMQACPRTGWSTTVTCNLPMHVESWGQITVLFHLLRRT